MKGRHGKGSSEHLKKGFLPPDLSIGPDGSVIDTSLPDVPNFLPTKLTGKPTHGDPSGKTILLNPNAVERLAVQTDAKGYQLSDEDYAQRLPDLVAARDQSIADSTGEVIGGPSRAIDNALTQSGLEDINLGSGEYNKARNLGQPITSIEQRDRSYFQRLLANNPQRAFGLNSNDIAKIATANTGMQNANSQAQYGSRLNQYQSASQQASANQAALIGGAGSLVGAGIKAYGNDPYLGSSGYGSGSVGAYNAAANNAPGGAVGYNAAGQAGSYDSGGNFSTSDTSSSGGI